MRRPGPSARVYPRTHGGTTCVSPKATSAAGLSPHTRGNPLRIVPSAVSHGSIPAHTGEPQIGPRWTDKCRVYPRTHGGTAPWQRGVADDQGLSPHTRGNHPGEPSGVDGAGSIPAHTGEPPQPGRRWCLDRVYPRTHGGTLIVDGRRESDEGLSPHTRGNRARRSGHNRRSGSIPAHTGEPEAGAARPDA